MDDGVRGRPGPTYRAAANLGVRAGMGGRRDRAGDRGRALREEEDGPDAWGRPVSGATRASGGARHAEERSGPRAWAVLAQGGDAGVGRVARWRAGERAGRESQLGHGERGEWVTLRWEKPWRLGQAGFWAGGVALRAGPARAGPMREKERAGLGCCWVGLGLVVGLGFLWFFFPFLILFTLSFQI